MKCVICGDKIQPQYNAKGIVIWTEGHNPEPITSHGRCCDKCNSDIVIPARIADIYVKERKDG
tara:strand:- start:301 stop:489 length:189 start_codon:yes stop_codon:yes gene_type:complete